MKQLNLNDRVTFTDKTGECLTGHITALEMDGNADILTVLCYKASWNMEVNCLVRRGSVKKLLK